MTTSAQTGIETMRLGGRGIWIVVVSSMEQIIGAALSTVVGVMLPMLQLTLHPEMSSMLQGAIGAVGLTGIAVGSAVLGKFSDRHGYLALFRICPLLVMLGAVICWMLPHRGFLISGLFIIGVGVGGGYSLDSAYISELLPKKWSQVMLGVAKATCAFGFIGAAFVCWLVLKEGVGPDFWNRLIIIIGILGLATLLMRIHWAESPKWLMEQGRSDDAAKAITVFFGKNSGLKPRPVAEMPDVKSPSWSSMFRGENLKRVIFSGIPWACEGLGVYGFGVFLPALVMTLGLDENTAQGMAKIANSVEITAIVNFFILPGFVIGLFLINRVNHVKMLYRGFLGSAFGLLLLLIGYMMHLPKWEMISGFVIFEVMLNAGPHLVTFIIPSSIYPVSDRGTGSGIAAMTGKIGAILGVAIMPVLIDAGGAELVLVVSIGVVLAGAAISYVYGKALGLLSPEAKDTGNSGY